ncbi:MAG: diguanylate cyclase [Desulfovibrionaceae bacterium]
MLSDLRPLCGGLVRIYLLAESAEVIALFKSLWPEDEVAWSVFSSGKDLLDHLFHEPPHILVAALHSRDLDGMEVLHVVSSDNIYRQICAILIIDTPSSLDENWEEEPVFADFIALPISLDVLRLRIALALRRSISALDANPLTHLPGNSSIIQSIQGYVNKKIDFALVYADIDNFKSFNDKYGFSRGDEALLMSARLIATTVGALEAQPCFVGHVGGDDFIFILPIDQVEDVCKKLIKAYDEIVPSFYDEEDRRRGFITAADRQGVLQTYPLLSLSLAVVINKDARFSHFGEMSYIAGQVKRKAKQTQGSCYVIDRRSHT